MPRLVSASFAFALSAVVLGACTFPPPDCYDRGYIDGCNGHPPEPLYAPPPAKVACSSVAMCPPESACIEASCADAAGACASSRSCAQGSSCVDARCVRGCSASQACPTGFGCDAARGLCLANPSPCGPLLRACGAGLVCVGARCVPDCAGLSCGPGDVCVTEGASSGCMPDEGITRACGSNADCGVRGVCWKGVCYDSSCNESVGECSAGTTCKHVFDATRDAGLLCVPDNELGTQCNLVAGHRCATGSVCVDGYCR